MRQQDIFNTVVTHILKQGAPANVGRRCQYITNDGRKCALGCLLPESTIEFMKLNNYIGGYYDLISQARMRMLQLPDYFIAEETFLTDLQAAHDSSSTAPDFLLCYKQFMKHIAKNYELDDSILG